MRPTTSSANSLGDRMKEYEDASRFYLPRRLPLIVRLDGKSFHTYTRGLERPYCLPLIAAMDEVAKFLCSEVQNAVLAYVQSDEISLVLVDYKEIKTNSWFDSNLQKIVSVSAGLASAKMTELSASIFGKMRLATFDARAFVLPPHDVANYLIWRQHDWNRNSLAMLAQSLYSHRELEGKGRAEQHEMCFRKGKNWSELPSHLKDGRVIVKKLVPKVVDRDIDAAAMTAPWIVTRSEWCVLEPTPIFIDAKSWIEELVAI